MSDLEWSCLVDIEQVPSRLMDKRHAIPTGKMFMRHDQQSLALPSDTSLPATQHYVSTKALLLHSMLCMPSAGCQELMEHGWWLRAAWGL